MKNYEAILETITTEQWEAIAAYASEKVTEVTSLEVRQTNLTLEQRVSILLHKIKCPPHIKGFKYLKYAITLVYNDGSYIECMTKALYPTVAQEFETTRSRVERAIRHAMECVFDFGDIEVLNEIFCWRLDKDKPTNSEAIACIVEYLKNH